MERQQFEKTMDRLLSYFQKKDNERLLAEYWIALNDIDPSDFSLTVSKAIANCRYFPTIAEIKEIYLAEVYCPPKPEDINEEELDFRAEASKNKEFIQQLDDNTKEHLLVRAKDHMLNEVKIPAWLEDVVPNTWHRILYNTAAELHKGGR